ncbi:MAG TPA: adenosylcobinamide-GDP ribazoletransferase [Acidimicrobiales bacterium]|nr:adenosylcobinamide-GDP ribazoletransferase [Acidimicrobiales bacterium]
MSGARRALAFLTPLGGAAAPGPDALAWFPVVGAGIGAVLGLLWWGTVRAWPATVAAALVVTADLALTGMLHLDGLIDSADGLLGHLTRERRLEVMRDPRSGAFGLAVGGTALLLRFVALAAVAPSIVLLVGIWTASRTVMAVVPVTVPYARADTGGLATAFVRAAPGRSDIVAVGVGTGVAAACVVLWHPVAGLVALFAGAAAAGGVIVLSVRRVGGFTGDVLGAAGVVLETVALVVAAAKW